MHEHEFVEKMAMAINHENTFDPMKYGIVIEHAGANVVRDHINMVPREIISQMAEEHGVPYEKVVSDMSIAIEYYTNPEEDAY